MISVDLALVLVGVAVIADLWWRWGVAWRAVCLGWAIAVRLVKWLAWRLRPVPITFGAARWLLEREAARLGLLGAEGLIIGKLGKRMLRFADVEGSVVVFAPQGAGKGVGVVVPNLLTYRGSVICTDPKGENHAVSRVARPNS